ncbi:MAG: TIGR04282 family arsenosugar biosynthesis glycosyltransferase [Planctomycetota bacterium]|nr:TIGR04282 family arsenosugar biosynthesis glycosyltransferase [Planctomycetota bacterium]
MRDEVTESIQAVIFAKVPRPGEVKTRLARTIGLEQAAKLAEAFLLDTYQSLANVPWAQPVVATTGPLVGELSSMEQWIQGDGDLGDRIERMVHRALATTDQVIVLGADTPGLPPVLLEQARVALQDADAVVGPGCDGGFYLLGLRHCPEGLLVGLPWSQKNTRMALLERLERFQLETHSIESWFDVDHPEDLERLIRGIEREQITAPATAAILAQMYR